jgi:hypothetical protein
VLTAIESKENANCTLGFGGRELMDLRLQKRNTLDQGRREFLQRQIEEREQSRAELLKQDSVRRLAEFNRKFAEEAIRLKVELSRRTGRLIDGPDDPTVELLWEHKLRDNSLQILCDFLQKMAEMLPNRTNRWLP